MPAQHDPHGESRKIDLHGPRGVLIGDHGHQVNTDTWITHNWYIHSSAWSLDLEDVLRQAARSGVQQPHPDRLRHAARSRNHDDVLGNLLNFGNELDASGEWSQYSWDLLLHVCALNRPAVVAEVVCGLRNWGWAYEEEYILGTAFQRSPTDVSDVVHAFPADTCEFGLRSFAARRSAEDIAELIPFTSERFCYFATVHTDPRVFARLISILQKSRGGAHKFRLRYIKSIWGNHYHVHHVARALELEGLQKEAKQIEKDACP